MTRIEQRTATTDKTQLHSQLAEKRARARVKLRTALALAGGGMQIDFASRAPGPSAGRKEQVRARTKLLAALTLLRTDAKIVLMAPSLMLFGFSAAFMNGIAALGRKLSAVFVRRFTVFSWHPMSYIH